MKPVVRPASGGLWKTTKTGITWDPIFVEMQTLSIGAIAIPDTQPNTIWVGTGEANILRGSLAGAGVFKSVDGGRTWEKVLYLNDQTGAIDLIMDPRNPNVLIASMWNRIRQRWSDPVPGGEGTLICVDPTNPNIMYSSSYYGRVERNEYANGRWTSKQIYTNPASKNIVPPPPADEPEYRGQWLAATIISPHDPSTLYHGFQFVFRSRDKGETWQKISPDLTAFDPSKQGKLPYTIFFATLTALSESPLKAGVLYAGSDDGRVHVTQDDGAHWTDISAGLPYYKHVWCIVASKYDPATLYIALIGRHDDDFNPYVYKSTNYGKTWTSIAANLPGGPTNVIREDPKRSDILYVGTDFGVFVTVDGAKSWSYLGSGLPNAAVWDLKVHPRDNRLVIATDGREMWYIDDVAPIQKAP